jgi:hypothetical protein
MLLRRVACQHPRGHRQPAPGQQAQCLVIEARRPERLLEHAVDVRPVAVRLQHEDLARPHSDLQQPVLPGLEAGGGAEALPER